MHPRLACDTMNVLGLLKYCIQDVILQYSWSGRVPERYDEKSRGKMFRFFQRKHGDKMLNIHYHFNFNVKVLSHRTSIRMYA